MTKKPAVSIGMKIYNEAKYIEETLDSLLAQDFKDFEILINDNASEDRTGDICRNYSKKDKRIHFVKHQKNLGVVKSFNELVKRASGKYFMLAGGHDKWHPSFVTQCIEVLEKDSSLVLSYTQTRVINDKGREVGVDPNLMDIRSLNGSGFNRLQQFNLVLWDCFGYYPIHGVIRTRMLQQTRLLRPTIGPDTILLAELALLGPFAQIPKPLFYARKLREFNEKEVLRRQFRYSFPEQNARKIHFPYANFAWQYLMVAKDAPPPIRFSQRVLIVISLIIKFTWEILRNPIRPFRTVRV